jgi:hypothetical protein
LQVSFWMVNSVYQVESRHRLNPVAAFSRRRLKDGHRYRSSVLFWADASAIGCSDYCLRDFPLAVASRVAI